jgi:hypothetical protein
MQMYVNYYDRQVKLPEENPTVQNQLYLPSKEELQIKLRDWTENEV